MSGFYACAHGAGQRGVSPLSHSRPILHVQCKANANRKTENKAPKANAVKLDNDKLVCDPLYLPSLQCGPVKVGNTPAKGRGVFATRDIKPGETLLVSEPIGPVVRGAPDPDPDLDPNLDRLRESLIQHLHRALAGLELSPGDRFRLRQLGPGPGSSSGSSNSSGSCGSSSQPPGSTNGNGSSSSSCSSSGSSSSLLQAMADAMHRDAARHQEKNATAATAATASKGFGSPPRRVSHPSKAKGPAPPQAAPSPRAPPGPDHLLQVIRHNAWAEDRPDTIASHLRGEPLKPFIGLWPEAALLNHSCVPTALPLVISNRLVVRAATAIPQGGEVTLNYLGHAAGRPLGARRGRLVQLYGFECCCPRCKVESQQEAEVQEALQQLAGWMEEGGVDDKVSAALAEGRRHAPGTQALHAELQRRLQGVEDRLGSAGVGAEHHPWLQSSLYPAYRLACLVRDHDSGHTDHEGQGGLAGLAQVFMPGGEEVLALTYGALHQATSKFGKEDARVVAAIKACLKAHLTRYGDVSNAVLARIMEVHEERRRLAVAGQQEDQAAAVAGQQDLAAARHD